MPVFYLGTHHPHWLRLPQFADVPLFVSRNRLAPYRTLPQATGRWAMDSGGFTELKHHGRWRLTAVEYVADVRRIIAGVGRLPDFVAPQDWMCEPWVIYGRGQPGSPQFFHGTREARGVALGGPEQELAEAVAFHQRRTVENLMDLRRLAPEIRWMPVVQGWRLDSYLRCVAMYEEAGIDLTAEPVVGLGSVCRRQATGEIAEIAGALAQEGIKTHGFGVKTSGLQTYGYAMTSCDSMSWSYNARYNPPLPGHKHKNCANCEEWALREYKRITRIPIQMSLLI